MLQRLRFAALDFGEGWPGGSQRVGLSRRHLGARLEAALLQEMANTVLLPLRCRATLVLGGAGSSGADSSGADSGCASRWTRPTSPHALLVHESYIRVDVAS